MTLTLELTPEEAARVEQAREQGVDVEAKLLETLAALPVRRIGPNPDDQTLELLEQWRKEAEAMTPEEVAEAERDLEEFKENIDSYRRELGMRTLFS